VLHLGFNSKFKLEDFRAAHLNNRQTRKGFYSKLEAFDQISETEWDQTMAVNVKGVWLCSKADNA
jgi:NAD(P)-dependent dehydrogenase (short-subunit alcohol dehydrogenase family)